MNSMSQSSITYLADIKIVWIWVENTEYCLTFVCIKFAKCKMLSLQLLTVTLEKLIMNSWYRKCYFHFSFVFTFTFSEIRLRIFILFCPPKMSKIVVFCPKFIWFLCLKFIGSPLLNVFCLLGCDAIKIEVLKFICAINYIN